MHSGYFYSAACRPPQCETNHGKIREFFVCPKNNRKSPFLPHSCEPARAEDHSCQLRVRVGLQTCNSVICPCGDTLASEVIDLINPKSEDCRDFFYYAEATVRAVLSGWRAYNNRRYDYFRSELATLCSHA